MPNASLLDTPAPAPASAPAPAYPPGTVRALLDTDLVTPPTRAALRARLAEGGPGGPRAPRFFGDVELATLRAACARLVPQPERGGPVEVPNGEPGRGDPPVDLAAAIDARLAEGAGNGWRYATMPPDPHAYALGVRGLDEHARAVFGAPFARLDDARQDAVLGAVQRGAARGDAWHALPAATFFAELLADVTECYYSHPLAQEEIGYAGMADAPGWRAVGLGQLEPREPRALSPAAGASDA